MPKAETASLAMMQALLQKGDYVGVCSESMPDYMASRGPFRKIAIDSNIRFYPITMVRNREQVSHSHGLHRLPEVMRAACPPPQSRRRSAPSAHSAGLL